MAHPLIIHLLKLNGSDLGDDDLQCSSYHHHTNTSNVCSYITNLPACQFDDGFLEYMQFVMCTFSEKYRPVAYILLILWILYLFVFLGVCAEDFFCPCLKTISKFLRMSDSLAGVTLLALGNGAPDIFSVIAAVNNKDPRTTAMAFQELFGAGIFVTTVVAGSINVSTSFMLARRPFLRDNVFYLIAVVWTFMVIYKQVIKTEEATGFIVLYALYVSIVIAGQIINRVMRKKITKSRERLITVPSSGSVDGDQYNNSLPDITEFPNTDDGDDQTFDNNEGDSQPSDPSVIGSITQDAAKEGKRHPRHRLIRDISISTDYTTFNYSADVAHYFKENRHKERAVNNINDVNLFLEDADAILRDFVRPMNFMERLTGIRKVNWKCQSLPSKMFTVIQVPIIFFLSITCPVADRDVQGQKWDKWLAMWHCFASPLFAVFALQVATTPIYNTFLLFHLVLIISSILAVIVFFTTSHTYTPKFHVIFALFGFAVAVIWIKSTAQEVVNLLETFGWITGLSYGIMGLTLLAWGNSIGDFISNLTMARNGAPRMAIAACYGGPLLNMLLGVGISCTMSALSDGGRKRIIRGTTQYILSALVLAISLISAITLLPINKFMSSKYIGIYLFALYGIYLLLSILHEADVLNIK